MSKSLGAPETLLEHCASRWMPRARSMPKALRAETRVGLPPRYLGAL